MKVKFISKWKEHRLVITPSYKQIVGATSQLMPGKSIQFSNSEFITENQEEIDFIRNHREFGTIINEVPSDQETKENILKLAKEIEAKEGKTVENKEEFKCDKCEFVAKSKIGLAAHSKKHNA